MAIDYERVNWDTTKFVNPSNMNQMDLGIKNACDGVDALEVSTGEIEEEITAINTNLTSYNVIDLRDALTSGYANVYQINNAKITHNKYMGLIEFQFKANADISSGDAQISLPFTIKNGGVICGLTTLNNSGAGFVNVYNSQLTLRCKNTNGQWLVGSVMFFINP